MRPLKSIAISVCFLLKVPQKATKRKQKAVSSKRIFVVSASSLSAFVGGGNSFSFAMSCLKVVVYTLAVTVLLGGKLGLLRLVNLPSNCFMSKSENNYMLFKRKENEQLILSVAIGKRKRAFVVFFFFWRSNLEK